MHSSKGNDFGIYSMSLPFELPINNQTTKGMIYIAKYCFSCGNVLENDICVQPRCKRDMRRFCEKCGAQSIDGIVFCLCCGEKFSEMPDPQPYVHTEGDYRLTSEEPVAIDDESTQRESPKVKKPPLIVMQEQPAHNMQTVDFNKSEIIEIEEPEIEQEDMGFKCSAFDDSSEIDVITEKGFDIVPDLNEDVRGFDPVIHTKCASTIRFDIFVPEEKRIPAVDRILAPKLQATHVLSKPNVFALNTVAGYGMERR